MRTGTKQAILVVEDEEPVRQLVVEMLCVLGYSATGAEDGAAALKYCQEKTFDLVLTDMIMPRMGGLELVQKLEEKHHGLRTLIMTGYGVQDCQKDQHFLQKPFDMNTLATCVASILDSSNRPPH